jgi:hypothetical protein
MAAKKTNENPKIEDATDQAGKDYVAKTPILFNGKKYEEGDTIRLNSKDAGPLLDRGAVEAK